MSNTPKLTIGVPVYNGEKFLKKRLESILSQTFKEFIILISDNNSCDNTSKICQDFMKKDSRIKYVRQKENIGLWENFTFLLNSCNTEYFVWAAVDDMWEPSFISENMDELLTHKKLVGCISKISRYEKTNEIKNSTDFLFRNIRKKILKSFRTYNTYPLTGNFESKIKTFLKKSDYLIMFSIFRTDILKKSWIQDSFVGLDVAFGFNLLRHGDVGVINKKLLIHYSDGVSTKSSIDLAKQLNKPKLGNLFPHYPLTSWVVRNSGSSFIRNLDHFILLNIGSELFLLIDLTRKIIKKFNRNKLKTLNFS